MTQNQLTYWRDQETARSNLARESETHRANVAHETETKRHNIASLNETIRHNTEMESIGWDSNSIAKQVAAETHRSNVARENETSRHNQALEALNAAQNAESARHNTASEGISRYNNLMSLAETKRHNVANEQQASVNLEYQQERDTADRKVAQQNADSNTRASWGTWLRGVSAAMHQAGEFIDWLLPGGN